MPFRSSQAKRVSPHMPAVGCTVTFPAVLGTKTSTEYEKLQPDLPDFPSSTDMCSSDIPVWQDLLQPLSKPRGQSSEQPRPETPGILSRGLQCRTPGRSCDQSPALNLHRQGCRELGEELLVALEAAVTLDEGG